MCKELSILKSTIELGLEEPIKLLHVTDTHIGARQECMDFFEAALAYAERNHLLVLHTGDMTRDSSEQDIAWSLQALEKVDYIFVPGNHDLTCPGNTGLDDPRYQWEYLRKLAPYFNQNLWFDSRIVNGVNFVTLLDVYYGITLGQTDMLRGEAAKGYPIILCMHMPLFDAVMADRILEKGRPCAHMVATPEGYYSRYADTFRIRQTPSAETLGAVEYIKGELGIKAIIAGHTHENSDEVLGCGKRQIVTGAALDGFVREITII